MIVVINWLLVNELIVSFLNHFVCKIWRTNWKTWSKEELGPSKDERDKLSIHQKKMDGEFVSKDDGKVLRFTPDESNQLTVLSHQEGKKNKALLFWWKASVSGPVHGKTFKIKPRCFSHTWPPQGRTKKANNCVKSKAMFTCKQILLKTAFFSQFAKKKKSCPHQRC